MPKNIENQNRLERVSQKKKINMKEKEGGNKIHLKLDKILDDKVNIFVCLISAL